MAGKKEKTKSGGDFMITALIALLSIFGLVMVYSASLYKSLSKYRNTYTFLLDDLKWMVLGWIVLIFFSYYDYKRLRKYGKLLLIIGLVLLGLIFTPLGLNLNNAVRWLDFKFFTVMPGEIIKFCLIIYMAAFYSIKPERIRTSIRVHKSETGQKIIEGIDTFGPTIWMFALMGTCFMLIYKQPNLSTAGIVVLLMVGIMFVAGLPLIYLFVVGGAGGAFGYVFFTSPKYEYQLERVMNFWDPFQDAQNSGYQVAQGLLALGSGGVKGVGLGRSIQKTLYLPEAQNDFILAIIGEELGFVGVIALMVVYLMLVWRICRVAVRCRDYFGMLLAAGIALHMSLQVILNIAVVSASFAPTGVVLPFVSLGGNATLLFFAEIGIVINISKHCELFDGAL